MKLGSKNITNLGKSSYVIAEVGVNHEGSLDLALRLVDLAKEGGADAVKFQTYKAEKLASKHSPSYWDTTKEPTRSQYELFKKYDAFGPREYETLKKRCDAIGIDFMSTPFDDDAVELLDPWMSTYKIASADLTNLPMLRRIASKRKAVLMSTGAASLGEISLAVDELYRHGAPEVGLLHCVLNYPTPLDRAHLYRIGKLKNIFAERAVIGYSDHTPPVNGCFPVLVAYSLGARIIEKHFTHDKTLPGNDHYHAMDVNDLRQLVASLKDIETLLGSGDEALFLQDQQAAIKNARRSVVAKGPLKKGERFTAENLTVKRPGTGIGPQHWDEILSMVATRNIEDDEVLQWTDVSRT